MERKVFKRVFALILAMLMVLNLNLVGAEQAEFSAKLYWAEDALQGVWYDVEGTDTGTVFDVSDFEPGSEVVRYLKIENAGILAFSYTLKLVADSVGTFADAIDVYFKNEIDGNVAISDMTSIGTLKDVINGDAVATGSIMPDGENADTAYTKETVVALALKMKENVPSDFMAGTTGDFSLKLDVTSFDSADKFDIKFENTDKYLYRVGNANTVALGSLFEAIAGAEIGNVSVSVNSLDENTDVAGVYTANETDWKSGTIQFSGTGPVEIVIDDDTYTNAVSLKLEVVDATNVTAYNNSMANTNAVLLNDIKMSSGGSIMFSGKSLYGNGFTFDVTAGAYESSGYLSGNYVIRLDNSILDNTKIVGAVYTQYGPTRNDAYNRATVLVGNNSVIANSYISNCAAPVRVNDGTVEIISSTLKGGNFANIDIRGGHIILDDVTTINQVNGNDTATDGTVVVGLGAVVYYQNVPESTTVEIKNGITQYNHLSKKQSETYIKDEYGKQLTSKMFESSFSDIQYIDGTDTWVNTGILSMSTEIGDAQISDVAGYVNAAPAMTGVTGYLHTKRPDAASIQGVIPDYTSEEQYAIAPSCTFTYPVEGNTNYVAKVEGSNDYCVYESGTVMISMDDGDTFSFDPSILSVNKAGQALEYTVTMNGTDYTGKMIEFKTAGNYTVTYTYTDNNNYCLDGEGNISTYSKIYTKNIHISVSVVKASLKNAVISVNKTAVNGVYVTVSGGFLSSDYKYRLNFLEPISVTDYDESGTGTTVDLTANIASATYVDANGSNQYGVNGGNSGTITVNYNDGRALTVKVGVWTGAISSTKTASIVTNDGVYWITDGASDNKENITFVMNGYTFKGNSGAIVENNTKVTYTWNEESSSSGGGGGCVTGDTSVTLADGSEKRIDEVTVDDELLVWDFYNGEYATVPAAIISNHGYANRDVVTLKFEDGTEVKVVDLHQFFDVDANEFVSIDTDSVAEYVGHSFVKRDGNGYKAVKLSDYEIEHKNTDSYGIVSALHYNILVEDMFSADYPYSVYDLMTYFEVGDNMVYDEEKMNADIATYGLYTYDEFAEYMTREEFDAMNIQYMKISVGKGYYTYEGILELIERWLAGYDDVVPSGEGGNVTEGGDVDPGLAPLSDDEPEIISNEPLNLTITSSGNKVTAADYAVTASSAVLTETITLTASGSATTGYAMVTINGDSFYTVQIAPGESISISVKNMENAVDNVVAIKAFWGSSADYGIVQESLIADGAEYDCGEFFVQSFEGITIALSNTMKKASKSVDVYVAVYDSEERLVGIRSERNVSVAANDKYSYTPELVIPENGTAKAFVWMAGSINPVFETSK